MAMKLSSNHFTDGLVATASALGSAHAGEAEMIKNIGTLKLMYERFNAKDIDGVVAMLADDVAWANGMDGGYVHGHDGIREYWTSQWSIVDPHVEPLSFSRLADGSILVEVKQVIRDLEGNPVEAHGLKDKTEGHIFHFADNEVTRFDIRDSGMK